MDWINKINKIEFFLGLKAAQFNPVSLIQIPATKAAFEFNRN